ncbi:MAG TPA: ureidoglycolate lyase [Aliidongia sp.]|nr:ureidoglycolate lyase [Aliidongia sp.]
MLITVAPLTSEAFAPFGTVVTHGGGEALMPYLDAFEHTLEAGHMSMAVLRVGTAVQGRVEVTRLERHPYSAQTFIPLKGGRSLVVVCGNEADGRPMLSSARAFIAGSGQGVTYRRNVWHRSVKALEAPSEYVVLMAQTGRGDDNVFYDLAQPLSVEAL